MSARNRIIMTRSFLFCCLVIGLGDKVSADAIDDAELLLQVSKIEGHYESMAQRQVRDIIRTYSSIVAMTVDVDLPREVTSTIARCYQEVYAWENFEAGIAQILTQELSQKEILLLIDFYQDLGLPPREIETFKGTVAKAPLLEKISADYIFSHSGNCVEHSSATIQRYLARLDNVMDAESSDSRTTAP